MLISSLVGADFPEFSEAARAAAQEFHQRLAKPPGSLGRLEEIAAYYVGAHGLMPPPAPERPTLVVFAADHGSTAEGVSAYPSAVTAAVVINVMAGGSAINALCRSNGIHLRLVDVGLSGNLSRAPREAAVPLECRSVGHGTQNFLQRAAMTPEQVHAALNVGQGVAQEAITAGSKLLAVGEIGIGNTACASALIAGVTGIPARSVVGPGAGLDAEGVERKIHVIEKALKRFRAGHPESAVRPADAAEAEVLQGARNAKVPRVNALTLLTELGGFEVAAMVGFILEAARRRTPVVLDGVVTGAAALVAAELVPNVRRFLLASHGSTEPGARVVNDRLALNPLLEFSMRLGEGSGAALGISLLRSAVDVMLQMSTLDAAIERAGLGPRGE
ncbi:MAG: nicotinate-nucleotide--dimethylbenzimidazole phosphoribosyltransferase [Polyangiaceae bacterium]|nr:nicotinate-nucleotide--dimethylbenzimidazole phosphoribosyltransferase [Polyangiaceae bacterium]